MKLDVAKLDVLMGDCVAGRLDIDQHPPAVFRYADSYLQRPDPTPLSTNLPLSSEPMDGDALANWMIGLMPGHEGVLQRLMDVFSKRFRRELNTFGPYEVLEQMSLLSTPMGSDCAGAVRFCVPERTEEMLGADSGFDALSDDEVCDWLRCLRDNFAYRRDGERFDRFTLAGNQPKIALRLTPSGWAQPRGAEPTSHILKVTRAKHFPHEGLMQHLTMRIAAAMGLPVPDTWVLEADDLEAIVVARYDRVLDARTGALARVHQEDLCQALGLAPYMKHHPRFDTPTVAVAAGVLRHLGWPKADPLVGPFLDLVIFGWLVVHADGHIKNYSLLLSGADCVLAPLYDANSWLPYRRGPIEETRMVMGIGDDDIVEATDRPEAILRTAEHFKMPPLAVAQRFEELAALDSTALPQALEDAVEALAPEAQNLPMVQQYVAEQHQRARRCHNIAARAVEEATTPRGT